MTDQVASKIRTLELVGWDLDDFSFRPGALDYAKLAHARDIVNRRGEDHSVSALCEEETRLLGDSLHALQSRLDLRQEMAGLEWQLGVVDLRRLLAFQRRLYFDASLRTAVRPSQLDWKDRIAIAFAAPKPLVADFVYQPERNTIILQSADRNLHLRMTGDAESPLAVHPGSPFFEVAQYANRWFLRDGYHRAYAMLSAGISELPAVIVHARTLAELGATGPQFFSEEILSGEHPPMVSDFLNKNLTLAYESPSLIKTLRITMEERLVPSNLASVPGEQS